MRWQGGDKVMQSQRSFVRPVVLAGWCCAAIAATWQIQSRTSDSALTLVAAALLVASLIANRYALKLPFTTAPMMYLSLLGLFHLGVIVPWTLRLYDIQRTPWFVPYGLFQGLVLIIYAFLAYQLGLFVALNGDHDGRKSVSNYSSLEDSRVFIAGIGLFALGETMFSVGLIQLDPAGYYRLTYSETFRLRAETDPRFFGTGIMISFIGLCMAAAGATRRQMRVVFLCTAVSFLTLFYLGFRGPALIAVLIVYAVAQKKGFRTSRWLPWAAAGLLLVAVPLESFVREQPLSSDVVTRSLRQMNILDGPAELGSAIRPLVETTALIGPGNFRHGSTYLIAVKGILPNIAVHWEAPSTESIDELPPNQWITAVVDPLAHKNYGGIGFSGIAEPYMNFGISGMMAYFFVLALVLVHLERVSLRSSYSLGSWAIVIGPLIMASTRNDFSNVLRPVVWGLICLGLLWLSTSLIGWRQRESFALKDA
jgi:hypothetical protein